MSHDAEHGHRHRDRLEVAQDTDRILDIVHRGHVHQEHDAPDILVSVQIPQVEDRLVERDTIPGDQTSILQSATDFDIHGGNFATVAGDFFTASRDLHVTIHNHPVSSVQNDDQQRRELSSNERREHLDETLLPPLPVQRSCDIYRRHLASKGRGIPLWIPEPNKNLPIQYQRNGIAIGDVGILTASGSFAFLFNICLSHDHPINPPNLPENFRPINVAPVNIHSQSEFKHNSYLASASTVRSQSDGDSTGLIFESSAHDGAILTMPVGSKSEDLGSTGRFRRYVAANMVNWYKYAYHDREYDVKNGDLRLVIGHDKTSFWGMATFSNSTAHQESFHLKFGLMEGRKYGWEYSGMAEVRAGPDSQEIAQLQDNDPTQDGINYENQCLFVRTMNATLPDKVWDELGFDAEGFDIDIGSDFLTNPSYTSSGQGNFGGGNFSNTNSSVLPASNNLGTKMNSRTTPTDNIVTIYASGSVYSSPLTLADHPSKAINSMLLENCSEEVKMVITQDQDWMSVLREDDFVLPSFAEILERVKASFVICQAEGIVYLSKAKEQLPPNTPTPPSANIPQEPEAHIKETGLLTLANIPGFSTGAIILSSTYREIERVKLYKQKCKDISDRCVNLMLSILDNSQGLDSKVVEIADEVETIAIHIDRTVKEWASWNRLKTFLRQGEIKDGIERLNRDIDGAATKFSIRIEIASMKTQREAKAVQERDKAEMREALQAIIKSSEDMKTLLSMQDSRPVEEVMESLQTELMDSSLQPNKGEDFKEDFKAGLWMLHEKTSRLPPLADLTGQVTKTSENPIALGVSSEIYKGYWLDHETVALRLFKTLNDPRIQRRFENEVSVWRGLNHPNVVPIYGIAHISSAIYAVSPWMDEGTVVAYVKKFPDVDRLNILTDVASGLEYLHNSGIIHGDLRGENVLLSISGIARLSDFGVSKFLDDYGKNVMTPNFNSTRWTAPEILQQSNSMSTHSDVWSFGMLCLEILSGNQPYSNIQRDIAVFREIENGNIPQRPREAASRGLSDGMWALLRKCWKKNPGSRPSMSYVRGQLLDLRGFGFSIDSKPGIPKSILRDGRTLQVARPSTMTSTSSHSSSLKTLDQESRSASSKPSTGTSNLTSLESPSLHIRSSRDNSLLKLPHHSVTAGDSFAEALSDSRVIAIVTDGSVLSGTLEGLVQHLITCNFNSRKDSEYRTVFLTVFPDFTTPEEFFSILSRRFHDVESDVDIHPEDRVEWQYNIFTILMYWLSHDDLKVDQQLLVEIKCFCEDAVRIKSSATMTNKVKDLLQLVDKREVKEGPIPRMMVLLDRKTLRSSEVTPHDLAIALTLLEGDKYKSLTPSDYLAHLRRHPGHNSMEGVYTTNNSIILWVKDAVLHYGGVSDRASVLKFFINTATECRKLRNFSSTVAIATALHSDPIERLRLTKTELSAQMHVKLGALKDILDVTANHRSYREALDDTTSTQGKENCVPWLAIHLKELHLILQRYPIVVNVDGRPLINFQRYSKFMDRIKEVVHYIPPDLEKYRQQGPLEYIEKELFKLELSKVTEDDLVARSKKFEAQETMAYRSRKSQMRSLGFTLVDKS